LAGGSWLIVLVTGSGSAVGVAVASSVSAVVVTLGAVWAGQAGISGDSAAGDLRIAVGQQAPLPSLVADSSPQAHRKSLSVPDQRSAGTEDAVVSRPTTVPAGPEREPVVLGDIPREPPAFQERPELLDTEIDSGSGRSAMVFAVTGLRGVGKTQLAAAWARQRLAERWRVVAWIDAEDRAQLLAGFDQLARELGLSPGGQDSYESAMRVRHWLEGDGSRCLLVLDNATGADMLRPFLPAVGNSQVVITSSHQSLASLGLAVPVGGFRRDQSVDFLNERTGLEDYDGAGRVAGELGDLPLALAQAASLIIGQRLEYGTYLSRLAAVPVASYLSRTEEDPYPRGCAEAIILSLIAIELSDPAQLRRRIMETASVLSAAGVSRALLAGALGAKQAEVDAALQSLADASLLTWSLDGSSVSAHRLVMRVVRERAVQDATLHTAIANAICGLQGMLESQVEARQNPARAREFVTQVMVLSEHTASFPAAIGDQDAQMLLKLRAWAGWYLNEVADASRAIPLLEQNLASYRQIRGHAHQDTLTARDSLATAYRLAGRLSEAIQLQVSNLTDRERVLGEDHPDTLVSRRNLGRTYRVAGRVDKAVTLLEQNLADCQRLFGDDHPETLAARNHLARAYRVAGRIDDATPLLERNAAAREEILGRDHIDTLTSRNNLADAYRVLGRPDEAATMLERNLADRRRVLGEDHADTLTSRNNLARAYQDLGRLNEATRMLEENLAHRRRVLGEDHPDTLTSRNNLASALSANGELPQAIRLYEENLAERQRVLGPDHPDTLMAVHNLAAAYNLTGHTKEAARLWTQDLASCQRLLSVGHPLTGAVLTSLQQAGKPRTSATKTRIDDQGA
jgi:tetratricopeptide (TPR) repeat protein